jgi:hypothetical protein
MALPLQAKLDESIGRADFLELGELVGVRAEMLAGQDPKTVMESMWRQRRQLCPPRCSLPRYCSNAGQERTGLAGSPTNVITLSPNVDIFYI